ncbi:putative stage II sporulation protein E [Oscillibacter valericigenes Sjm18-20]|nr:putative stage II sporulation protein E [Oscillibacter valericigenes Sjm18-20]
MENDKREGTSLMHGQITLDNARTVRFLNGGVRFFLAAALTAARISGGAAPFALGFTAACGAGLDGMCALAGAALGALVFLEFSNGLAHIAVAILVYTAAVAFRGLKLMDKPLFTPLVASGMTLAVEGIYVAQSLSPLDHLTPCLLSTVLAGVSARCYAPLTRGGEEEKKSEALVFLVVTLLLAFSDVTPAGISLGRTAIASMVLFTAWQKGAASGAVTGVWAGLLADLCAGGGVPVFTAGYGFAGLAAGLRAQHSRLSAGALWLLAVLTALAPVTQAQGVSAVKEAALAVPLFLLVPRKLLGGKRIKQTVPSESGALPTLRERLDRAAAAFRDLYDSLGRGPIQSTEENPAIVFDRAAERVCRGCALCDLCWKKEYGATYNALNDATPYLLERGRALAKDFPNHFSSRCIHLPDFLTAINGELSAFLLRKQYRRRMEETRQDAKGQYARLSDLLTATAANLEAVPAAGARRGYQIGAAIKPKQGESACGDTLASFETDAGLLCLLLSDGMGSGEAARRESALTCRLLRQFLEAGVEAEAALNTMNAAMALRGQETGSFSTIDLLTLRLESGEAALYKYGAAPTYIKRFGRVRRITGAALPAGLKPSPAGPDVTHISLEPETFAVLISDGTADSGHDEWLQNLLAGWSGTDPQLLANLILREAEKQNGLVDDCCVQVLYLPPEETRKV